MKSDVAIVGIGMIPFGELWDRSLRDMATEAALAAVADAGVDHVDSLVVGAMSTGLFNGQEHVNNLLADYLGMTPIPATRVESACASGGMALRAAVAEVASGMSETCLVVGVEKMNDVTGDEATDVLIAASDAEYEAFHGATFPALNAMIARAYMERYGATPEHMAAVAVKNHANGALNPMAQFRRPVTPEFVLRSPLVADPIRMMDSAPLSDGAAALVVCSAERAAKLASKLPVRIAGVGCATDIMALAQRDDITWLRAVAESTEKALAMAGRKLSDVDVAEVHDAFTITELLIMEAIGLVERGQAGPAVADGLTALDGRLPLNPSGGLKAKGHPVGATGVAQACEIVAQLRGEADRRQVKGAKVGVIQNMGGCAGTSVTHVLEAE